MSNIDLSQLLTANAKAEAEAAANKEAVQTAALAYLADTDWYVTRKVEMGKEIPEEILSARTAARAALG